MHPIFGLVTQLFVSKGLKHLDGNAAKPETKRTPWSAEGQRLLEEYERQTRRENWTMILVAIGVILTFSLLGWWLNKH